MSEIILDVSDCRSCGAPIFWAITPSGKRIPLDAEPVEQRGLFVFDNGYAKPPPVVYQSHFATCPDADSWRKE